MLPPFYKKIINVVCNTHTRTHAQRHTHTHARRQTQTCNTRIKTQTITHTQAHKHTRTRRDEEIGWCARVFRYFTASSHHLRVAYRFSRRQDRNGGACMENIAPRRRRCVVVRVVVVAQPDHPNIVIINYIIASQTHSTATEYNNKVS